MILKDYGINTKEISVVLKDKETAEEINEDVGESVAEGAAGGAATGAVIGGIAGLLGGLGAVTIPGFGLLMAAGPIASALGLTGAAAATASGAVTGAAAGGIVGALVGLGFPEETAEEYEREIEAGGILVAAPTTDADADEVKDILDNHGADNIRSVEVAKYSI